MTSPTTGLPEWCPETRMFNKFRHPEHPGFHHRNSFCWKYHCTPVEIHPQGTGNLIAAQREYIELLSNSYQEHAGFLVIHGKYVSPENVQRCLELRAKIQSLTPGAPDANAMEPENDPTWEFQDEAGPEDMEPENDPTWEFQDEAGPEDMEDA